MKEVEKVLLLSVIVAVAMAILLSLCGCSEDNPTEPKQLKTTVTVKLQVHMTGRYGQIVYYDEENQRQVINEAYWLWKYEKEYKRARWLKVEAWTDNMGTSEIKDVDCEGWIIVNGDTVDYMKTTSTYAQVQLKYLIP